LTPKKKKNFCAEKKRILHHVKIIPLSQGQRGCDPGVPGRVQSPDRVHRRRVGRPLRGDRVQAGLVRHTLVLDHVRACLSAVQDFSPVGHAAFG